MNTLKNHVILYDAECPMCNLYTRAFTATGMLDTNGRAPYQQVLDPNGRTPLEFACPLVDRQRAVNEIALVDKTTGEVRYGIDSLFAIIANSFPVFSPLFKCQPFHWAMRKLYAFISYNRKVIIPAPKASTHSTQPSFQLRYRLAWLLFTAILTGCILSAYAKLLTPWIPIGNPWREYSICSGQILFQGAIVSLITRGKRAASAPNKPWDYLGNLMTISLAGSLLLLPMLGITALLHPSTPATTAPTHFSPLLPAGYFLLVVALMFLEHIRRTKLLNLGRTLTITWIAYRLLVLGLVFL